MKSSRKYWFFATIFLSVTLLFIFAGLGFHSGSNHSNVLQNSFSLMQTETQARLPPDKFDEPLIDKTGLVNCPLPIQIKGRTYCHRGNYSLASIPALLEAAQETNTPVVISQPTASNYTFTGAAAILNISIYIGYDVDNLGPFWALTKIY